MYSRCRGRRIREVLEVDLGWMDGWMEGLPMEFLKRKRRDEDKEWGTGNGKREEGREIATNAYSAQERDQDVPNPIGMQVSRYKKGDDSFDLPRLPLRTLCSSFHFTSSHALIHFL
jgi:hypothetical protein